MRMKSLLVVTAILFASPAFAAETAKPAAPPTIPVAGTIQNPKEMPGGLYNLDSSHAHTVFFINHMGFSEYTGVFNDIKGQMVFHPEKPETSKLDVTIKTDSIDVQSDELDKTLKSAAFFDAATYPEIKFVSRDIRPLSERHGTLTGDLTMHGVTKPVILEVKFVGGGTMPMKNVKTMGFTATGMLKRSDFGITGYLPGLGDDIRLDISAEFNYVDSKPPQPSK